VNIVADAPLTGDTFEDRWVGNTLGTYCQHLRAFDEKRFICTYPAGIDNPRYLWGSRIGKTHIAFAQYPAAKFPGLHYWHKRVYEPVSV
jgi:hypothetical protein